MRGVSRVPLRAPGEGKDEVKGRDVIVRQALPTGGPQPPAAIPVRTSRQIQSAAHGWRSKFRLRTFD
ncbi:hypothetical protein N7532_012130 [Penicillium argentinense]|uniref:Uncharacterized protein n=1 Tax=Penicillium argentinense TaxID=1131581 RepID=A0A9W9JVX2_9EURO|nr:uncharacterized protein N7532_012130 [Penicillium argentinense]KAJ5083087.1 hypothetical protein N7532_012130 [Penicillium argentinense]